MIIALVLIVIGVVFFAKALGFLGDNTIEVLWPLLLVIIGLAMLSNRAFGTCCDDGKCWSCRVGKRTHGKSK